MKANSKLLMNETVNARDIMAKRPIISNIMILLFCESFLANGIAQNEPILEAVQETNGKINVGLYSFILLFRASKVFRMQFHPQR